MAKALIEFLLILRRRYRTSLPLVVKSYYGSRRVKYGDDINSCFDILTSIWISIKKHFSIDVYSGEQCKPDIISNKLFIGKFINFCCLIILRGLG